jgi:putative aldouronate transport system permease protein
VIQHFSKLFKKKTGKVNRETGIDKTFSILNVFMVILFCVATIYPFVYVVSASFSSPESIQQNKVVLLPVGPVSTDAYKLIFRDARIWRGYANTLFYAGFGVIINLIVTILAAYPMSRRTFSGRKFMNIMVVVTMFISPTAVMIPLFLLVKNLGMYDTRLAILIVFAAHAFLIILMRSFFQSIPEEMFEAAKIDGAGEFTILMKIVLPVSMASLATMGMYYLIQRWNGYFWAMIFLKDETKFPLQVILRQLIVIARMGEEMDAAISRTQTNAQAVQYSTIVASTLPMIVIYPFIQRFFIKGATLGSVKG